MSRRARPAQGSATTSISDEPSSRCCRTRATWTPPPSSPAIWLQRPTITADAIGGEWLPHAATGASMDPADSDVLRTTIGTYRPFARLGRVIRLLAPRPAADRLRIRPRPIAARAKRGPTAPAGRPGPPDAGRGSIGSD